MPAAVSQQCGASGDKCGIPEELINYKVLLIARGVRQQEKSQVGKRKYEIFIHGIFCTNICRKS